MIGKIIYEDGRDYTCNDCGKAARFKSHKAAKAVGWAVARNYINCYCPDCAPARRNVGKYGVRRNAIQQSFDILTKR